MGGGSSGSIGGGGIETQSTRSTSTRGTASTVVGRNRQYDYRRMTESLWTPPPLANSASMTAMGTDTRDYIGGRKTMPQTGREEAEAATAMGASNDGRTMSSVGVQFSL